MATILGVTAAENYERAAIKASTVGDPIIPGIGCMTEADFNSVDADSVTVFYEPSLKSQDPATAPGDYTTENSTNTPILIPMLSFYHHASKLYKALANSLPYDKMAMNLDKEMAAFAKARATGALAVLIAEGTESASSDAITQDNIKETVLNDVAAIRATGANPTIAICTPDIWAKLVLAAGTALQMDEANTRLLGATVGYFLGVRWVETPLFSADMKYNVVEGNNVTTKTADGSSVGYILYDGSKFANIARINEVGLKDGGAQFAGASACIDGQYGAEVIEKSAVIVRKVNP